MEKSKMDNVFVLCTGRCGSTTFIRACKHIKNYTARHESRSHLCGAERLNYPTGHIEADNRLSWFLGRLDKKFGKSACYVHLKRNIKKTAESFVKRYEKGIINAYRKELLLNYEDKKKPIEICKDYCRTVNSNIELFMKDKPMNMTVRVNSFESHFSDFWNFIGAKGDISTALDELKNKYNTSEESNKSYIRNILKKLR